jgi:hypothetical protein
MDNNQSQIIKAVFEEGELVEEATIKENLIVQLEGERTVQRLAG